MPRVANKVLVDLFYDVLSPYSWFAFESLTRFSKKCSTMELKLRPVFIGGLMQQTGNQPPASVPAKALYMSKDLPRLGKYYQLPFNTPEDIMGVLFKKGSLVTQRLLTAVHEEHPSYLEGLTRVLFLRIWSKDQDIVSVESLNESCKQAGIPDKYIDSLISRTQDADIKQALKDTTQAALNHGAFGVPTFVAHLDNGPEMLFGEDRLFLLAHYLNEPFPGPLNELKDDKL